MPAPAGRILPTKCTVDWYDVPTVLDCQNRVLEIRPKAGTRSPAGDAPTPSAGVSLPERIQTARRSFALAIRGSDSQNLAASSRQKRGSSCGRARPEFTPATNAAGFVRIGRRLKNRTKRRFHCARKVRSASTTPRGHSGRTNASDRVQDARTGCADGPGPPEPRPRNVPKGGYTVDGRLRADTVLGTDISYRGHIRTARGAASPPSGALPARISHLAAVKNGDRAVGAVSGPAVCQDAQSRRARRPPPTTRAAGKRVGTTAGASHEGETTAVASGIAVCAETDGVWCAPETRIVFVSNAGGLGTNGRGSKNGGFERFHYARTRGAHNSRITFCTAGRTLRMKCVVLGRAVRTVYGPRKEVLKIGFWAGLFAPATEAESLQLAAGEGGDHAGYGIPYTNTQNAFRAREVSISCITPVPPIGIYSYNNPKYRNLASSPVIRQSVGPNPDPTNNNVIGYDADDWWPWPCDCRMRLIKHNDNTLGAVLRENDGSRDTPGRTSPRHGLPEHARRWLETYLHVECFRGRFHSTHRETPEATQDRILKLGAGLDPPPAGFVARCNGHHQHDSWAHQ
ncbi:hypothetical protein V8D89_003085 [Ganoderma adspersum]